MTWLIRLGGTLLAVALLATPLSAVTLDEAVPQWVKWTGCKARVVTSYDHHGVESFYSPNSHTLYIGLARTPERHLLMIVLHESGHCLQMQKGYLVPLYNAGGNRAIELDADRIATDLACGLNLDGPQLLRDLFEWALATYGYEGDADHGTLDERVAQAKNSLTCRIMQAPKESPIR